MAAKALTLSVLWKKEGTSAARWRESIRRRAAQYPRPLKRSPTSLETYLKIAFWGLFLSLVWYPVSKISAHYPFFPMRGFNALTLKLPPPQAVRFMATRPCIPTPTTRRFRFT